MEELKKLYIEKKHEITQRLDDFRKTGKSGGAKVFAELCFCLLTPQSKAINGDIAIKRMKKESILYSGTQTQIRKALGGVRFPNNKTKYVMQAQEQFIKNGRSVLAKVLSEKDNLTLRGQLAKLIKGYGLKEASHFLRNIGRADDLAILDRHILKELLKYNVIKEIPKNLTEQKYLELEDKMRQFSKAVKIPMDALDLLFWYNETRYFFK